MAVKHRGHLTTNLVTSGPPLHLLKNYVLFDCSDPENIFNSSRQKCFNFYRRRNAGLMLLFFVGESKCKLTPIGVKAQLQPLSAYTYLYFAMWQIMA